MVVQTSDSGQDVPAPSRFLAGVRGLVVAESEEARRWAQWIERRGAQAQCAGTAIRAVALMAGAATAGTPFGLVIVGHTSTTMGAAMGAASLAGLLATLPGHQACLMAAVGQMTEQALEEVLHRFPFVETEQATDETGTDDIDAGLLRQLMEDFGSEDVAGLVQAFLQETETRIARMTEAAASGDITLLEREAHTLKGNAGNMGFAGLSAASGTLVGLCRAGHHPQACLAAGQIPPQLRRLHLTLARDYPQLLA